MVVLGDTLTTAKSWGEDTATTTIGIVTSKCPGILLTPSPCILRMYVPGGVVELALIVKDIVAFGEV